MGGRRSRTGVAPATCQKPARRATGRRTWPRHRPRPPCELRGPADRSARQALRQAVPRQRTAATSLIITSYNEGKGAAAAPSRAADRSSPAGRSPCGHSAQRALRFIDGSSELFTAATGRRPPHRAAPWAAAREEGEGRGGHVRREPLSRLSCPESGSGASLESQVCIRNASRTSLTQRFALTPRSPRRGCRLGRYNILLGSNLTPMFRELMYGSHASAVSVGIHALWLHEVILRVLPPSACRSCATRHVSMMGDNAGVLFQDLHAAFEQTWWLDRLSLPLNTPADSRPHSFETMWRANLMQIM